MGGYSLKSNPASFKFLANDPRRDLIAIFGVGCDGSQNKTDLQQLPSQANAQFA